MEFQVEDSLLNEYPFLDQWDRDAKQSLEGYTEGGTMEEGTLPMAPLTKDSDPCLSADSTEDNKFAVGDAPLARDGNDSCQSSASSEY